MKQKNIDQMTNDEIRRELSEIKGWFVSWFFNHLAWQATLHGEYNTRGKPAKSYDECWQQFFKLGLVPDWPNDKIASLELCLEVITEYPNTWDLIFTSEGVGFWQGEEIIESVDWHDASSLAKLALLGFRKMAELGITKEMYA